MFKQHQYEHNTPCEPEGGDYVGLLHDADHYKNLISDDDVIRGYRGRGVDLTVHMEEVHEDNHDTYYHKKLKNLKDRCETEYKMTRFCVQLECELQLGDLDRPSDKYEGIKSFENPTGEPLKLEFFAHGRAATTYEIFEEKRISEGNESKSKKCVKRECRYIDVSEYRLSYKGTTLAEWEFDGGAAFPNIWEGISGQYKHALGEEPRSCPMFDYSINPGSGLTGKEHTEYTPKGGFDPALCYLVAHVHARSLNHLNLLGGHFWPNTVSDPSTMMERMGGYHIPDELVKA